MAVDVGGSGRLAPGSAAPRFLRAYAGAAAILLLGLTLTGLAALVARDSERDRISTILERRAEAQQQAIRFGVRDRLATLLAVRGLYAGSDEVSVEDFDGFLRHTPLRWGEIEAVAWATSVDERLQIDFCRPVETCGRINWSDLFARTRPAFETIRWTNGLTAAGPLAPPGGGAPRYLAISDVSVVDPASTPRLRGYVIGVIAIDRLIERILSEATAPAGLEIYFYDVDAGRRLVHFHASRLHGADAGPRHESDLRAGMHFEASVDFTNRKLDLLLAPTDDAVAELRTGLPLVAATLGLVVTAGLTGYAATGARRQEKLARAADRAESDLDQRNEELAAANELLHGIVESSPAVILALDPEGRVILWNPAAERVFGYSREEAIGMAHPIVPPDQRAAFDALMRRVMAGEAMRDVEVIRQRKSGERLQLRASGGALHGRGGQLMGAVFVVEDVTERRAVEQQLAQAQKMEAVGQLTGGVAHDFNNLLQVILGCADLLCAELSPDDPRREFGTMILEAAQRGATLTRQLLAFSRKQALEPQVLDANEAVREIEPLLRRTLGEAIELETALSPELAPAFVDRGQLETALLNLAVNARDAMPSGGRLIIETASVELDEDYAAQRAEVTPGEYVMIAVSDTGSGMPPEVLQRIFEPFFTTKPAGKGTGLGLSMVFGFVKQSKGHVSVYSEVGHGTTVRLYLPRAQGADAAARRREPERESRAASPGQTILYVEDDPQVRKFGMAQLSSLGYRVIEAAAPDQALAVLSGRERVDLLFTDIVFGAQMNGWELSERARKLRPDLKVLFASGYNESVVVRGGMLKPGVQLLRKPYRRAELARRLSDLLARR